MNLTYRARRNLKRAGIIALAVVLLSTAVWGCWVVWLARHIVYTREGAVIEYGFTDQDLGDGQLAEPPVEIETVSIFYANDAEEEVVSTELTRISGYYIDFDMLSTDMETVRAAVASLPVGSAVMMEVKNGRGDFYYTSAIEGTDTVSDLDVEAVNELISDIASRNLYLIASLPAFRDRHYGLQNTSCGLPFVGGGGALWVDDTNCYWLDPTKDGTLEYLTQIIDELKTMGFDEVMFTDFRFPDSENLDFSGSKSSAIQLAATTLVSNCASDRFAVSFFAGDSTVQGVDGRSRLYLSGVEAENTASVATSYNLEDPTLHLVFLTDSYDTRYDTYSVLRPMSSFASGQ